MKCSTPCLPVPNHLPKFAQLPLMSIASVMLSTHLILWHSLLLLPSIFPRIRDFSSESSVLIRWPKYWNFSFSINPSNEYSGVISLKFDWFDLLDVQGNFSSLLQHHSLKASIGWCSSFFTVHSHTMRDYWEDNSLDYMDLCWQSNVSAFQHIVQVCHSFPARDSKIMLVC